ncbi:hypothetical protein NUW58_g6051 [Xylaria curta]|uniref:Uncharacterized protein n=1 Tax=Xylaria curta TaxID=42375 RepID=A0ACC1NYP1_9PEZI|nr:hypothetical protein NUW58_g6051 [Xylaria curta]
MGDPGNTNSSEMDRRASHRVSTTLSHVLDDPDDDQYGLQAMAVSDGFRPVDVTQDHVSPVPRPSISSPEPPFAGPLSPRPSSVSKPPPAHESSSVNGLERSPARSSGISTEAAVMPVETPYEGPSGPSHPYQMYPQDVRLVRTASLATTSTVPISERSYRGPHRPTHPYAIYSQTVVPEDNGFGDRSPQGDVNVGFSGSAGGYQRRLGPDGEETADMIGPDGHTEQLPPYSRYPIEAYARKTVGTNAAQSVPTSTPAQQNLEIPGAGGIGLATRNPEFASTEDLNQLNSPHSRQSIRSFRSEASHHSISAAALTAVTNEKPTSTWREAAKKRVWGVVPCWAVGLGVLILVLLGVVIGTVIGTVIAPQLNKSRDRDGPPYSATRSAPDFIPLPTVPPGLPSLAEGPFSLPLFNPRFMNTCFKDPSQGRAWSCEATMSQLTMSIRRRQNAPDIAAYALDFTFNHSYTQDSFVYTYGVQPPSLIDQQLQLVNDTFERSRGPAWAFAIPYNKTIVLPEEYLMVSNTSSSSSSSSKAQRRMAFPFDFKRKGLAQSGEKPWICTWPGTLLEVFIYAGQNSSFKFPIPSSSSTSTSSSPLPTESSSGAQSVTAYRRDAPFDYSWLHSYYVTKAPTTTSTTPSTTSTTTQTSTEKPDYFRHPPMPPPLYPPYPNVIKVEERRNPEIEGPVPVCRQVEIIDKGIEARPVRNDKGEPVEIHIAELMEDDMRESDPYFDDRRRFFGQHRWSRDDGLRASTSRGNALVDVAVKTYFLTGVVSNLLPAGAWYSRERPPRATPASRSISLREPQQTHDFSSPSPASSPLSRCPAWPAPVGWSSNAHLAREAVEEVAEPPIIKLRWSPRNTAILAIAPDSGGTLITIYHAHTLNSLTYFLPNHDLSAEPLDAAWTSDTEFLLCGGELLALLMYTDQKITEVQKLKTRDGDSLTHVQYDPQCCLAATGGEKGIVDSPIPANERLLASGGEDGAIFIWNALATDGAAKCSMTMGPAIVALAFTPDGAFIAGATSERILIWKVGDHSIPRATWSRVPHPGWLSPRMNPESDEEDEHCLGWDSTGHKLAYGVNSRLAIISFR